MAERFIEMKDKLKTSGSKSHLTSPPFPYVLSEISGRKRGQLGLNRTPLIHSFTKLYYVSTNAGLHTQGKK
jgi:hypothetical protein